MTAQPLSRETAIPTPEKKTAPKKAAETEGSTKVAKSTAKSTSKSTAKSTAKTVAKTVAKPATRQRTATKSVGVLDFPLPDNVQSLPVQVQASPVMGSRRVDRTPLTTIESTIASVNEAIEQLTTIARQMDALARPTLTWEPIEVKIPDRRQDRHQDRHQRPVAAASPNYWGGNVARPDRLRSQTPELPSVSASPVLDRVSKRTQPLATPPGPGIAAKPTLIRTSSSRPIPPLYDHQPVVHPAVQPVPSQPIARPTYVGSGRSIRPVAPQPPIPQPSISRSYPQRFRTTTRTTTRTTRYTLTYFYQLFQQLLPIPSQPSAIVFDAALWTMGSVGVHVAFQILIKIIPALSFPLHLVMLFPALFAAYLAFCVPKSSTPFVYRCLLTTLGFFFGSKL